VHGIFFAGVKFRKMILKIASCLQDKSHFINYQVFIIFIRSANRKKDSVYAAGISTFSAHKLPFSKNLAIFAKID